MQVSTVIGIGILVGTLVFALTGVPEIALFAGALTKIILPEKGESRSTTELLDEAL